MDTITKGRMKSFLQGSLANKIVAVAVVLAIGVSGYLLVTTKASGFFAAAEPDSGTLSGNATVVSDSSASGGKALQFNAPASTGGGGGSGGGGGGGGSTSRSCPAYPAFPDASCTGYPAGTSFTTHTGDVTITTANTVIDSEHIIGCVDVEAPGVTIRNSFIECANASPDAVFSGDGNYSGTGLTIQDTEIDCKNNVGTTAVGDTNVTTLRLNIHGCENGYDIDAHIHATDNYIHDLANSTESHTDGMQFAIGHYVSATDHSIINGVIDVDIIHNTILSRGAPGQPAGTTSAIISNRTPIDQKVIIQNNLLAGGAYTLYCDGGGTTNTAAIPDNYVVKGNHFSTIYYPTIGAYGPSSDCGDENLSGNVYHETGLPISLAD